MKVRNPEIELYRMVLMFGICLLHAIMQGGHGGLESAKVLFFCVNGFVFISGWFGIQCSVRRIVKLFGVSIYAGCSTLILLWWIMPEALGSRNEVLPHIKYILINQWFLVSYSCLVLVAPMLNAFVEKMNPRMSLNQVWFLVVLCLWNWSVEVDTVRLVVPKVPGFGSYTPVTLALTYVFARIVRKYDLINTMDIRVLGLVMTILLLFVYGCDINLYCYASPLSIMLAAVSFGIFLKVKLSLMNWLSKFICWLGPSMFTIYLFHSHKLGFELLARIENFLLKLGLCDWETYILTALIIFMSGIVIDVPRRLMIGLLHDLAPRR